MVYRLILPNWAKELAPSKPKVVEGKLSFEQIIEYNEESYNCYYLPNYPSNYESGTVDGTHIDTFEYVFVDMDLKDKVYEDKTDFLVAIGAADIGPSRIVDSGNGLHVYWKVSNLDAMSYLRFQRRLMRLFKTDESLATLYQLMRLPGTINTKNQDNPVPCELLAEYDITYTCEELDRLLPPITSEDEKSCIEHYEKTFNINQEKYEVNEELTPKFGKLLRDNPEVKELWSSPTDDRSKNDFRLGHIMFANGFSKEEAASVLVNSAKALQRAPKHRRAYATNIIDKIWTYEEQPTEKPPELSQSVEEILELKQSELEGQRFPCHKYIDDTASGFRLGHVMGLVAGSGVGKTAMALNLFLGFVKSNPDYVHFFVPLEQPAREIALRWKTMCGTNNRLHSKVQILSNYDEKGAFRDLSLEDIKQHILQFKEKTGKEIGCVVIDHIGILCNNNKLGQDEGVKQIAKAMKGFATETNTFLIMQSQTSREKAGIGDLELNKDAAFGTSVFENFCDYLVTIWQPLKRMYASGAPTIMAYKFCKIRHKKQGVDKIQEDVPYSLFFDPQTELLREITQDEEKSFVFYLAGAASRRKADRKTEVIPYISIKWSENENEVSRSSDKSDIRQTNMHKNETH